MIRILLVCCYLVLVSLGGYAQLTLDECRLLACEHYPAVRQYDLIRLSREYTLSNAEKAYYPQISVLAEATWQTAVPGFSKDMIWILTQKNYDLPGINKDQYKLALELNQTIWDGGKLKADRQMAVAEYDVQKRSADVDMYTLKGRVDDIFFGILLMDERIVQTKSTMDLLRSNLDKIRSLQRNGLAMQSDADALEAELLSVRQQLVRLRTGRESFVRMLELFIGRSIGDEQLLKPAMVEMSSFESNNRPELALFNATIDKYSAKELSVKSSLRPQIGLFAQGFYGYPGLNFIENMVSQKWSWNAVVGVRMSWNFGAYYTKRNTFNLLKVAKEQTAVQRDVFLFNTWLQIAEENGEIARLKMMLADDDRIIILRRKVREAAESKLRNGVIDTNDLLSKITEESNAITARLAREIELLKTLYELKHTVNQ